MPSQFNTPPNDSRRSSKKIIIIIAVICIVLAAAAVTVGVIFLLNQNDGSSPGTAVASADSASKKDGDTDKKDDNTVQDDYAMPESYMIDNVEVISQTDLKAGCETYACTMLLNSLGFDVDEHTIADNYLNTHYLSWDENGKAFGPDMHSAFAGSPYAGWGVYAPSMAKSMNSYLQDQHSTLKAYDYKDIPLETLCRDYVSRDIPVMVWATTDMEEPYVFDSWTVDYVDENAEAKIGDTVDWYMHEHCLVLIGYDENEYYFADSAAGAVSHFDKELVKLRYEQMFSQCIVVK